MIEIPMTETQFAAATQRLRTNGIELTGTSGTLSKDGVTAKYTYAEESWRLRSWTGRLCCRFR